MELFSYDKAEPVEEIGIGYKYIETIRSSGYDFKKAMEDPADNSIDAGADKISILFLGKRSKIDTIILMDNGSGMDETTLKDSFKLGADSGHTKQDLGKFGVGGTIGCLSLAEKKTTYTRDSPKGEFLGRGYDLELCKVHDKWVTRPSVSMPPEYVEMFEKHFGPGSTGTIIVLEGLDRMRDRRADNLRNAILKSFGQTYCEFINARKLEIVIDGKTVEPKDPLCWNHSDVKQLLDEQLSHDGFDFRLQAVDLTDVPSSDVPGYLIGGQGGYFFRCHRLIKGGVMNGDGINGHFTRHADRRNFRFKVSMDASLDDAMGIDYMKSKIDLVSEINDKINDKINPLSTQLRIATNRANATSTSAGRTKTLGKANSVINSPLIKPSNKRAKGKSSKNSSKNKVTNIATGKSKAVRKPEFVFKEVQKGELSFTSDLVGDTIEINVDHPFTKKYYVDRGEDARNCFIAHEASSHLARIEVGEYEDCDNTEVFRHYFRKKNDKMAAWAGIE